MHGSYAANRAVNECDVLFSIRTRFNDRVTGKISEFGAKCKNNTYSLIQNNGLMR